MSGEGHEQQAPEQGDNQPLIEGEQSGVAGRFKKAWRGLLGGVGLNKSRPSEQHEDQVSSNSDTHAQETQDIETGTIGSPAQSLTPENREPRVSEVGPSRPEFHQNDSNTSLERGSPHNLSESGSSSDGILSSLWRLGGAAIPQPQRNSTVNATCLICLEPLSAEEFASGEAIVLDCECRGDVAMRHRACVEKWTHVKGNRTCDICKTLIKNLPDPPPRASESATPNGQMDDDILRSNAQLIVDQTPTGTDVVFDCIRVTWIAMIVSILFFGMDIANALWTGAIVGMGYTICVRAMYQYQLRLFLREQQRERENDEQGHTHVVVI